MSYDGTYRGLTSQQQNIGFRVSGNQIVQFWFGVDYEDREACRASTGDRFLSGHGCLEGSGPGSCGWPAMPYAVGTDGSFDFTDTWTNSRGERFTRRFTGRFVGLAGALQVQQGSHPCRASVTWNLLGRS